MMGERTVMQEALLYEFSIDRWRRGQSPRLSKLILCAGVRFPLLSIEISRRKSARSDAIVRKQSVGYRPQVRHTHAYRQWSSPTPPPFPGLRPDLRCQRDDLRNRCFVSTSSHLP
jgi:hypothetical protein